jgi:hypothetical protein
MNMQTPVYTGPNFNLLNMKMRNVTCSKAARSSRTLLKTAAAAAAAAAAAVWCETCTSAELQNRNCATFTTTLTTATLLYCFSVQSSNCDVCACYLQLLRYRCCHRCCSAMFKLVTYALVKPTTTELQRIVRKPTTWVLTRRHCCCLSQYFCQKKLFYSLFVYVW